MNTLRRKFLFGLAGLTLAAASLGLGAGVDAIARKVNEYEGQHFARKVNEYEGQHLARKVNEYEGQHLARKVNEYEGQHVAALVLPLHPEKVNEYEGQHAKVAGDPSQW